MGKRCLVIGGIIILSIGLWCETAHSQVLYAAQWHPAYTTEVFQAPAPSNLVARETAFKERNSDENIKQLAQDLFKLMRMRGKYPPAEICQAFQAKDYRKALELYRDFFIRRLQAAPADYPIKPKPPQSRVFVEFLYQLEDLMSNQVVWAMEDSNKKNVNVRVDIGAPGRVNWTWQPAGFTNASSYLPKDESFASALLGARNGFDILLTAYLKTQDPVYLERWGALTDDRCFNWQRDTWDAGLKLFTDWHFNMENYFYGVFPAMAYLAQNTTKFSADFPAPTLARMLIELWSLCMPLDVRAARQSCPNRRVGMFGCHLFNLGVCFPEFLPADYCLREWRRALEGYAALFVYPDGSDFECSRNYNMGYFNQAMEKWNYLKARLNPRPPDYETAPPWLTREWVKELRDNIALRPAFMIHYLANSGYRLEFGGYILRGEESRKKVATAWDRQVLPEAPQALEDPDNARILSCLYGDGNLGEPSFTSEAFPYIGSYLLRTGWGREDLFMFLKSSPQPSWGDNNNLHLEAYGQDFFWPVWDSPLVVDGLPQGNGMEYREDDKIGEIRRTGKVPDYSLRKLLLNNRKTMPNRWYTSDDIDLCEGFCVMPYSREFWRRKDAESGPRVTDVTHYRQVLLLRGPRLLIITDRLKSPTTHTYRIHWRLVRPVEAYKQMVPGFVLKQIIVNADQPSIKTQNPDIPNISIYPFAPFALSMGTVTNGIGPLDELYCGYKFEGQGELVVVTVMYPRRTIQDEVARISPLNGKNGVAGFQAELTGGTRLAYQAAARAEPLTAEELSGTASSLLWVRGSNGVVRGLALDCNALTLRGKAVPNLPGADLAFTLPVSDAVSLQPIYRPLEPVEFFPKPDVFTGQVEVTMASATPGAEIRYTLDGTSPQGNSPLYTGPITIKNTRQVKARAFRPGVTTVPPTASGTEVSAVTWTFYTKEAARVPAKIGKVNPGLKCDYYEGDWSLSAPTIDIMKPVRSDVVPELFDLNLRKTQGKYGFVYSGYLVIPQDGVYSFHAPQEMVYPIMDAAYDLRVFLAGEEWYPATRHHNYGVWSVPLQAGAYPFKVVYVDQRPGIEKWHYGEKRNPDWMWDGEKPLLEISGPGLAKQPVPSMMLFH